MASGQRRRRVPSPILVLSLAALLGAPGCGTIVALDEPKYTPYYGVYMDFFLPVRLAPFGLFFFPLAICDVPLSFVADTFLLPYALWENRSRSVEPTPTYASQEYAYAPPRPSETYFSTIATLESDVVALALSRDETHIAAGGAFGVVVYSVAPITSFEPTVVWRSQAAVSQLAWSPDGRLLATASSVAGTIRVLDGRDGHECGSLASRGDSVAFESSGTVVAVEPDLTVHMHDLKTGEMREVRPTPPAAKPSERIAGLRFALSPDGENLAVQRWWFVAAEARWNTEESLITLATGRVVWRENVDSPEEGLDRNVVFHPSARGGVAFQGARTHRVQIFDRTGNPRSEANLGSITRTAPDDSGATCVTYTEDGGWLAVGKTNGSTDVFYLDGRPSGYFLRPEGDNALLPMRALVFAREPYIRFAGQGPRLVCWRPVPD
jgi:uncharacterized protein YceK/WD40 repeat protein